MKIAFIFAHRDTDVWSTPLSVVNEFKRIGWETKIYSLFGSHDEYIDDNFLKLKDDGFNPDIVFYMDWGRCNSPLLGKSIYPKAYWIMESGDDPQNFKNNSPKSDRFDLILTPDFNSYLDYKKMGRDVMWWTHFADTNIHKIYHKSFHSYPDLYPVRCTRGEKNTPMLDYFSYILGDKFKNTSSLYGEEYGKFLSGGLITLQLSRWGEITRRIFEGAACGTLVMTDRLDKEKNMDMLFVENEDIVYYDSIQECISKINYYLIHKEERQKIAENGYKKVILNHTQITRVQDIIQKYNKHARK